MNTRTFENGDIDIRFGYERMQWTETVCDSCAGVIMASEHRWMRDDAILCEECEREDRPEDAGS